MLLEFLSMTALLKRTFSIYLKRFFLFIGIVLIFTITHKLTHGLLIIMSSFMAMIIRNAITFVMQLFSFFVIHILFYFLMQGATVAAVSDVYLEHATGLRKALMRLKGNLFNILFVVIAVSLPIIIICIIAVIFFNTDYIRVITGNNATISASIRESLYLQGSIFWAPIAMIFTVPLALAIPALVMENLNPIAAMKRSLTLTKGKLWRLLTVFIFVVIVGYFIDYVFRFLVTRMAGGQFLRLSSIAIGADSGLWLRFLVMILMLLFVSAGPILASCLVVPLGTIAISLIYCDQRTRKEGTGTEQRNESSQVLNN